MAAKAHISPPTHRQSCRRIVTQYPIAHRRVRHRERPSRCRFQHRRSEGQDGRAFAAGALSEQDYAASVFQRLRDLAVDPRKIALISSIDENRSEASAEAPNDGPALDILLCYKQAVELRRKNNNVHVAEMIRHQQKRCGRRIATRFYFQTEYECGNSSPSAKHRRLPARPSAR